MRSKIGGIRIVKKRFPTHTVIVNEPLIYAVSPMPGLVIDTSALPHTADLILDCTDAVPKVLKDRQHSVHNLDISTTTRPFVARPMGVDTSNALESLLKVLERQSIVYNVTRLNSKLVGWSVDVPTVLAGGLTDDVDHELWNNFRELSSYQFIAVPVEGDDRAGRRYPTGQITCRFRDVVDDSILKQTANDYNLTLIERAAFTKREAHFEPAFVASVYLPTLRTRIANDPRVEAVWLDCESVYRRGDQSSDAST